MGASILVPGYHDIMGICMTPPQEMDKDGNKKKCLQGIILKVQVVFIIGLNIWIVLWDDDF